MTRHRRPMAPAHRLTPQQRLDIPDGLTPAEERRRYFHDVGIASRIRIHRELAVEHETCPLCNEALR